MRQDDETDSKWPLLSVVFGGLVLCCTIELLATGGIGLSVIGLTGSWSLLIGLGALLICLGVGLFGYKIFAKDRDSLCSTE
jgi:hypothetical protein